MDLRSMIRRGQVKMSPDSELVVDGHRIRPSDGTRLTVSPVEKQRRKRRKANKTARASRKANRG